MSAAVIDGKKIAFRVKSELKARLDALPRERRPGLAVVLVGDDPASGVYVRQKERACEETGIRSYVHSLPETTEEELLALIGRLNESPDVHGILVQLPLPTELSAKEVIAAIRPEKDVDGFNPVNVGGLWTDGGGVAPCTPSGIMALIDSTGVDIEGKEAVIIGRSNIVGKPVAAMLLSRNCTVTVCHSRTVGLAEFTRRADVLVAAAGRPGFVTGDMIKKGSVIVDVGINRVDGALVGDVDFASASETASWITPVPGGVGPMTIAMLMKNTLRLAGII